MRVPAAGEATKRNEVLAAMKTLEGGDSAASTTVLTAVAAAAGKDRSVVAMTGHAPVAGDDASGTNGYVDVLFFGYYLFDIYCLDIIVLTMLKDHEHFKHAMANGALGYLVKDEAFDQLVLAIRTVLKGKQYVSPSVASLLADRFVRSLDESDAPSLDILTKREIEVLKLIAAGLANKNVADKLKISIRTVETHRANLTNKLGIKTTAGLVKFAMSKGIV